MSFGTDNKSSVSAWYYYVFTFIRKEIMYVAKVQSHKNSVRWSSVLGCRLGSPKYFSVCLIFDLKLLKQWQEGYSDSPLCFPESGK